MSGVVTDQEILLRTFAELEKIAAKYKQPNPLAAEITLHVILSFLNRRDVVAAARRLKAGYGLRVVK